MLPVCYHEDMPASAPLVKLTDHPQLADFLSAQTAATLAVPIDANGAVHAASLLYWHSLSPLRFYFVTAETTEKFTLLRTQPSIPAALVIGTDKGTPFTVQLRGTLAVIDPKKNLNIVDAYYQKRGNRSDDIDDPKNHLLLFTPTWGRFTDYAKGYAHFFLDLA